MEPQQGKNRLACSCCLTGCACAWADRGSLSDATESRPPLIRRPRLLSNNSTTPQRGADEAPRHVEIKVLFMGVGASDRSMQQARAHLLIVPACVEALRTKGGLLLLLLLVVGCLNHDPTQIFFLRYCSRLRVRNVGHLRELIFDPSIHSWGRVAGPRTLQRASPWISKSQGKEHMTSEGGKKRSYARAFSLWRGVVEALGALVHPAGSTLVPPAPPVSRIDIDAGLSIAEGNHATTPCSSSSSCGPHHTCDWHHPPQTANTDTA